MIKTIFAGLLIMMLSLSVIAFPLAASGQNPNEKSNEKPQMVSAMGKIPGKDLAVHMWVLVQHGADKDEVVKQALAKHGAQHFVSEKFVTNGVYWNQFGDGSLDNDFVTQNYNPQNDPSGGAGLSALLNTHTTWNNVATSSFVFDYGSETSRCPSLVDECPGSQVYDGYNDVAWVDLGGSNILGVTWYGLSIDEADIALNTSFTWATDGTNHYDIETVMLHENGHVLGLSHSSYSQAVMYTSYHGVLRVLHSDDIAGISSLYPWSEPDNVPPSANAGPNQTVTDSDDNGNESVTLNGSGSSDSDGSIAAYVWTNSNNEVIGNTVSITPTVPLGINVYTLSVTDDDGDTNTDTVSVTVESPVEPDNVPPSANAGPNQTVTDSDDNGNESVTLNGSGSSDSDGSIAAYVWTNSNNEVIGNTVSITPTVPLGINVYTLSVTDDDGDTNTDTVSVTVESPVEPQVPSISITNPLDGSVVNGKLTITASVTGITTPTVSFYLDGTKIGTDSNAPYELGVHTKNWKAGFYEIKVSVVTDESAELNSQVTVEKEQKGGKTTSGDSGGNCPTAKKAKGKC
ncbi:MAG: matrixin family metalloprotease [Nitrosopumilus sp.]|nr:matrixin family metalloprotease [Nitrosopumilus sp.]